MPFGQDVLGPQVSLSLAPRERARVYRAGRVDWLACLTWGTNLVDRPGGLSRLMNSADLTSLTDLDNWGVGDFFFIIVLVIYWFVYCYYFLEGLGTLLFFRGGGLGGVEFLFRYLFFVVIRE